jgi:GH25 family lysozyme M1 (1,4-beta-N-acetylmuramidase)
MTVETDRELEEWVNTAVGLKLNPDRAFGNQCVDVPDAYAEAIFGVPWPQSMGGVNGAKELLDAAPDAFWIRTDNNPNNPHQLPKRYDVVVFGGSASNQWGHVAIVLSADQNGMWVLQQDGFAAPHVFVNNNWYSDRPVEKVWLPYYSGGTGSVIGWLTPKEERIVGYRPPSVEQPLLGYQRVTVPDASVGYRDAPNAQATLIRWLDPDTIYDFRGFVRTEKEGVWFVGKHTGGYSKATGFIDEGTHDLEDLTPVLAPVVPVPLAPPQPPAPITLTKGPHLNGIDVSGHNAKADLDKLNSDFYIIKATEGGSNWTDPHLADNVAEARRTGKPIGFYHFARPLAGDGNTAEEEARSFLAAIKPYLQDGDTVWLDWEAENQHRSDWAGTWLDIVAAATGAVPGIYLNSGAIAGANWDYVEANYPLWFAGGRIYDQPTDGFVPRDIADAQIGWVAGCPMWQYTGRGRLAGYEGDLDLNVWYGTDAQWREMGAKLKKDEPLPTPAPGPSPQPTPTPVPNEREVVMGWFIRALDKV